VCNTWESLEFNLGFYPWPGSPIVHAGPNSVVPRTDGCLVLASCSLHLTGEGLQGIFSLLSFGRQRYPCNVGKESYVYSVD
jgi:hypothetical protein